MMDGLFVGKEKKIGEFEYRMDCEYFVKKGPRDNVEKKEGL